MKTSPKEMASRTIPVATIESVHVTCEAWQSRRRMDFPEQERQATAPAQEPDDDGDPLQEGCHTGDASEGRQDARDCVEDGCCEREWEVTGEYD